MTEPINQTYSVGAGTWLFRIFILALFISAPTMCYFDRQEAARIEKEEAAEKAAQQEKFREEIRQAKAAQKELIKHPENARPRSDWYNREMQKIERRRLERRIDAIRELKGYE